MDLASLFDLTVMVQATERELEARLTARWQGFNYDPQALKVKMEGNDLPNMRFVLVNSVAADIVVRSDNVEP